MKRVVAVLIGLVISASLAWGQASLLPNGKQQFIGNTGTPLGSGTVDLYVPTTTTRKNSWTNATETSLNTNPVVLDSAGRAVIYGQGSYRQIVKDSTGATIWDATTAAPSSTASTFITDAAPVGTMLAYSGLTLPANHLWAGGQELSRATYPQLLSAITSTQTVITTSGSTTIGGMSDTSQFRADMPVEGGCFPVGTRTASVPAFTASTAVMSAAAISSGACVVTFFPWGNGNGTTTYNAPDMRGRAPAGRDNINGTAANMLTSTFCPGANALGLGAYCGTQSKTLSTNELAAHSHASPAVAAQPHTHFVANVDNIASGALTAANRLVNVATQGAAVSAYTLAGSATAATIGLTSSVTETIDVAPVTGSVGISAAFSIVQPVSISNWIVKYQSLDPTSNGGVISINGMTGDITCSGVLSCSGGVLSIVGVGSGDVIGPSVSVDRTLPQFSGTTGKLLAQSGIYAPGLVYTIGSLYTNFTAQTPGGALIVGANTVTLAPCPLGVAGSDTNHYLYISNGIGAAEAVLITGGTCMSGITSGTVQFTAANTHSGAWTIQSATTGIDEALRLSAKPAVKLPIGIYSNFSPSIVIPTGATIECVGAATDLDVNAPCRIQHNRTNTPLFADNGNTDWSIRRLSLESVVTATAGSVGVKTTGINYSLDQLTIWRFNVGYDCDTSSWSQVTNIHVFASISHGVLSRGCQGPWDNFDSESNGGSGIKLDLNGVGQNAIPFMTRMHTFNNGGWGIEAIAGLEAKQVYLNFDFNGEILLDMPIAAGAGTGKCQTLQTGSIEVAGGTITFGTNTSAPGIKVSATSGSPLCMTDVKINTNQGNGAQFDGPLNKIYNSHVFGNGIGGVAGNIYQVKAPVGNTTLIGNAFNGTNGLQIVTSLNLITNNTFGTNSATVPSLDILAGAGFNNIVEGNITSNAAGGGIAMRTAAGTTFATPFVNYAVQGINSFGGTVNGTMYTTAISIYGSTSGTTSLQVAAVAGAGIIRFPAGSVDFSATGGAGQAVFQTSVGGIFTTRRPACTDLSDAGPNCNNPTPATGSVTSVATTAPITGGTFTTSGTIACATCVTSAAALTNNQLVLGQGGQATAVLGGSGIPNLTAGAVALVTPGSGIDISGSTLQITAARRTLPTHQFLTSGTDATYTVTSANVLYIKIRLVGGGGGGAGGGSGTPGAGVSGGSTCFKTSGTACTSPLISATGGSGVAGSTGGAAGGGGGVSCNVNIVGGDGSGGVPSLSGSFNGLGGKGGDGMFGGGGGAVTGGTGNPGAAYGSGGAGGAATSGGTNNSGSGGGAGGGCEHWISSPAATYVYTIGAAGTAGGAGTNGAAGGAGKIGYIVIDEYYN